MGRLIDADKLKNIFLKSRSKVFDYRIVIQEIAYAPTVQAIPKADYENRLKADMEAMLTDFLMDIEENTSINATNSDERNGKRLMRTEIIKMLEDKINSLKEAKDGLHTR